MCVWGCGLKVWYCILVPGASVDGLVVMEVCPDGLTMEWRSPNPRLLGGPVEEVDYVLTSTSSPQDSVPVTATFSYDSSLTVSQSF